MLLLIYLLIIVIILFLLYKIINVSEEGEGFKCRWRGVVLDGWCSEDKKYCEGDLCEGTWEDNPFPDPCQDSDSIHSVDSGDLCDQLQYEKKYEDMIQD